MIGDLKWWCLANKVWWNQLENIRKIVEQQRRKILFISFNWIRVEYDIYAADFCLCNLMPFLIIYPQKKRRKYCVNALLVDQCVPYFHHCILFRITNNFAINVKIDFCWVRRKWNGKGTTKKKTNCFVEKLVKTQLKIISKSKSIKLNDWIGHWELETNMIISREFTIEFNNSFECYEAHTHHIRH